MCTIDLSEKMGDAFKSVKIHDSWKDFFQKNKNLVPSIEDIEDYTPDANSIFHFATQDLKKIKVVILGRDPYPKAENIATGRAFEDNSVINWSDKKPDSLIGILKLLYKSYNMSPNDFSLDMKNINKELKNKRFKILPPQDLFNNWENSGVLLLNTALTVKKNGDYGSHESHWKEFTKALIKYIDTEVNRLESDNKKTLIWFLWGEHARNYCQFIKNGIIYCSDHPSNYKAHTPFSFMNSNCFRSTSNIIKWLG